MIDELLTDLLASQPSYKAYPFCISILPILEHKSDGLESKILEEAIRAAIVYKGHEEHDLREYSVIIRNEIETLVHYQNYHFILSKVFNGIFEEFKANQTHLQDYIILLARLYDMARRNIRIQNKFIFDHHSFFEDYLFSEPLAYIAYIFVIKKWNQYFIQNLINFINYYGKHVFLNIGNIYYRNPFYYRLRDMFWVYQTQKESLISIEKNLRDLEKVGISIQLMLNKYEEDLNKGITIDYFSSNIEEVIKTLPKLRRKEVIIFFIEQICRYYQIYVHGLGTTKINKELYNKYLIDINGNKYESVLQYIADNSSDMNLSRKVILQLNLQLG